MDKRWVIPLLLVLPVILILFWGFHLTEAAYGALRSAQFAVRDLGLFSNVDAGLKTLVTPLYPLAIILLSRLGLEAIFLASLISALGWGVAAVLMLWLGWKLDFYLGGLVAAVLFTFNPWIITSLGQETGWTIAALWLLANLALRRKYLALILVLFLIALSFWPFQPIIPVIVVVPPLLWSVFLFTIGIGAERFATYLKKNAQTPLSQHQATVLSISLLFLCVGIWQAIQISQQFHERPAALWKLEEQAAAWLQSHSKADATMLASQKLGFLVGRDVLASDPEELLALLPENAPDYVVTGSTIPWQMLKESLRFQLSYEPLLTLDDPYAVQTPIEVWGYRPEQEDLGLRKVLNARVPDRLSVIGYQLGSQLIHEGQTLDIALYLQAPQATIADRVPFQAILRLVSLVDDETVDEWTVDMPQSLSPQDWQPSQVIVERVQLNLPEHLESASYLLNLSLVGKGQRELWPFSFNNDVNRLDRIPLDYVSVPWEGNLNDMRPLDAGFEHGIRLAGYESGEASAGEPLDIILYWQADKFVEDEYTVFVHLLDGNGCLVTNHDGSPADSRYPTIAWQPGMIIPDRHVLNLAPNLASGQYEIRAGLYNLQTGERVALRAINGEPLDSDSVTLGTINIE